MYGKFLFGWHVGTSLPTCQLYLHTAIKHASYTITINGLIIHSKLCCRWPSHVHKRAWRIRHGGSLRHYWNFRQILPLRVSKPAIKAEMGVTDFHWSVIKRRAARFSGCLRTILSHYGNDMKPENGSLSTTQIIFLLK